jgi:hypothetical protein
MTELSPAAQAVLDAALPHMVHRYSVAAALRAVVDQVAPEKTIEDIDYVHQSYVDGYKDALCEILNLVDELETQ